MNDRLRGRDGGDDNDRLSGRAGADWQRGNDGDHKLGDGSTAVA
jgi:hypothetical protein